MVGNDEGAQNWRRTSKDLLLVSLYTGGGMISKNYGSESRSQYRGRNDERPNGILNVVELRFD